MKRWKKFSICFAVCLMMALSVVMSAFATSAPTVDSIMSDFTTGITAQVGGIMSAIGTVAVAGLGIFALVLAIRLGLKVFRSVTGR